ncbi:MAG: glycosyltransferase family 2 protein [Acidobacteriota bacterium]
MTDERRETRATAGVEEQTLELSIVMPCLNEAETVGRCVSEALSFLTSSGVTGEVVVADNGSTDGSRELAVTAGARVVTIGERGYGAALLGGIGAARGRFVVMGDADGSYDFTALGSFLSRLREGYQLVMGNRFAGGIAPGAMPGLHRYVGNPLLSAIGRLFYRSRCRDFHCGLRAFHRGAILALDLRTTGMEFASEMVVKATLGGLRVAEVPTTLRPDGRSTAPKLRTWHDGWRHLRFLLLYSPRWLFLVPGMTMVIGGSLVGAVLLPGPRTVGGVTFDVHTLLYAGMAVVIGFQAIGFALFTTVFAVSEGLLPETARVRSMLRLASLEGGLVVGTVIFGLGVGGSLWAVRVWDATSFGNLDPAHMLRTVIPAVVACTLGCEVILASFFLSVLRLPRRR